MKLVLSASRRSDMLTCYPEKLSEEIIKIGAENIHTLVLWTKNPLPSLSNPVLLELLGTLDQIYLNLTVTGLGGSFLEPKVPLPEQIFEHMPQIVKIVGSPQRICLRYDPLIEVADSQGKRFSILVIRHFFLFLSKPLALKFRLSEPHTQPITGRLQPDLNVWG